MTVKKEPFRQIRILAFAFTFVCFCALILTGAILPKEKVVNSQERVIRLANSPVRILLKGNESYRISLDGKNFSRDLPQRNEIRLRNQVFDPIVNPPKNDISQVMSVPGDIKLYIVQCVTQAIEAYQQEIAAAGGEICGALPHQALLVTMSGDTCIAVQKMPFVRWVGVYHSGFKLYQGHEPNVSRTTTANKTRYSIWLTKKNKKDDVSNFIDSIGGEVVLKGKSRRMEAKLNQNQLDKLAARAEVLAVDLWTPYEEDMNIVRDTSGGNYVETVQGYTGQGVRAEVCDGGLRTTHVDFQANPPIIHGSNSSSTSHGTPVTGIVFGDGTGEAIARGMIPDAEQPFFSSYSYITDRYAHTQELVNPTGSYRAVFQTNSWGSTRTFFYTTISAEMDEIIFDLDILICQSQSNAGNQDSRPQAWAKNIVAVGGLRHYNTLDRGDDCWCTSASIGPADDGRIKPDVWHFYDYTRAPYYLSDTSYTEFGGTSGATPITAGHMGLIFQMWADGVFDGGPGQNRDVFNYRPHCTTAKALLIHSAYQYPFSGTSHDKTRMHQGWGMADVQNLYDLADAHNWNLPVLIDESAVITPLAVHSYDVNVDGTEPLKATLVYADPPGVPGAAVHRINDLSLKVTAPGGTTYYWGNNGLDIGVWSSSGGSSNTIDTVENVFIESPAAGTWTIQVFADEVVQDGHVETPALDADYALVVSGGSGGIPDPPPAAPTGLAATAGLRLVTLDWDDNTEPDLASYNVKRSTAAGGPYSQIDNVTISSYTDNTGTAGTTYYYVVTAVDAGSHESGNSNEASAAPYDDPPAAPSGLSANAVACDQVDLAWTDNSNNETSFKIERGTDGVNFSQIDTVGAGVTGYSDTTVVENITYWYRVRASNAFGDSAYSNSASDTTPPCPAGPPAAPSSLTAKAWKDRVRLTWTDNADNEDGFRIYRGITSTNLTLHDTVGPDTTLYDDTTGLVRKTTYYYKVCAYNANGEGCPAIIQTRTK
jgi:serine protease AprX